MGISFTDKVFCRNIHRNNYKKKTATEFPVTTEIMEAYTKLDGF
jgi:hypothetical protein